MANEPQVTGNGAHITDDQLKTMVGGGLVAFLVLGLVGVPLLGGIGAVVAVAAGVGLFARSKKS